MSESEMQNELNVQFGYVLCVQQVSFSTCSVFVCVYVYVGLFSFLLSSFISVFFLSVD